MLTYTNLNWSSDLGKYKGFSVYTKVKVTISLRCHAITNLICSLSPVMY